MSAKTKKHASIGLVISLHEILVDPSLNPRRRRVESSHERAAVEELAATMRAQGLLEPVILERLTPPRGAYRYRLRIGFRRHEAARMLGWKEIEAKVMDADAIDFHEAAIAENVGRASLLPVERAIAYAALSKKGLRDYQIADRVGTSRRTVQMFRCIGEHLAPRLLEHWERAPGILSTDEASKISQLSHEKQIEFLERRLGAPTMDKDPKRAMLRKQRQKGHSRGAMTKLMVDIEGGLYDRRGEDWKAGALAVLNLLLEGEEVAP